MLTHLYIYGEGGAVVFTLSEGRPMQTLKTPGLKYLK